MESERVKNTVTLVVVLGHRNDTFGILSEPSAKRVATAAGAAVEHNADVLPTGGYGHFNETKLPHFRYVTAALEDAGVAPERILPGALTGSTVEDLLAARKRAIDEGYRRLILVTSHFHETRVQYLGHAVFPDLPFVVEAAGSAEAENQELMLREAGKTGKLRKAGFATPLYRAPGDAFPEAAYRAATTREVVNDVLAFVALLVLVSLNIGIIAVGLRVGIPALLATAGLNVLLAYLASRFADAADIARRTAYGIEAGWDQRGYAAMRGMAGRANALAGPLAWWIGWILAVVYVVAVWMQATQ